MTAITRAQVDAHTVDTGDDVGLDGEEDEIGLPEPATETKTELSS
ncbi:hypothetical protein ACLI4R_17590 [Natrialbaceae archaeon A-chndr2]